MPAPGPIAPRAATWDGTLGAALYPSSTVAAQLERLGTPGALAVTTGQQPGLFTGPLYTIHKAVAAQALAARLEREWRRPVVPIFWLAGDDHDFREASVARWIDRSGELVTWRLTDRPPDAPQLPMYRQQLTEARVGLGLLEASLPAGPGRDATVAWLARHYRDGATLQQACGGALAELLAPFGIVVLDPTHPAFKQRQAPILAAALRAAAELDTRLAELPGVDTGITAGHGETLVFIETVAGRDRLVIDGDGYRARRSGEAFTSTRIEQLLADEPARFSANVLLRPIVESALLPTVAYVGGAAEIRYQTQQSAALYAPLGVSPQQPVRRWGGTVVEAWADRLLARLDLTPEQVQGDDGSIGRRILRQDLPAEATATIAELREHLAAADTALRAAGAAIDPVLDRSIAGRMHHLAVTVDAIERSLERHLRKRDATAWQQFARLRAAFLPGGVPQERSLTAATFLARYPRDWLAAVGAAATAWCRA